MYGSTAASKDSDLKFAYKKEGGGGDLSRQQMRLSQQGLLRYRSAASLLLGEVYDDAVESTLARFLSPNSQFPPLHPLSPMSRGEESHSVFYHHQQQLLGNQINHNLSTAVESEQIKAEASASGGGDASCCPSLIRHGSSPAGFFSHLNVENGYGLMSSMSGLRNGNNSTTEASNMAASSGRLRSQLSYSSRQGSAISKISEIRSDGMGCGSPEESSGGGRCYVPGYPVNFSDNFSGLKRAREPGLSQSNLQNGETTNNATGLTHQFSLPRATSELAAIEKFLLSSDAIPCKVRAKRGCATHPRSIAERVRRTRISERMRKLQELVPNMEKQTNTSDMLDSAMEYVKDLQRQVKSLSDNRASCTCSTEKSNR